MESKHNIKNVVLVHGAIADGSGWEAVANILKNDGYKVSVAQPPETSYADDQKYTKAAIDAMGGPVVLVGHSYRGGPTSRPPRGPDSLRRSFHSPADSSCWRPRRYGPQSRPPRPCTGWQRSHP